MVSDVMRKLTMTLLLAACSSVAMAGGSGGHCTHFLFWEICDHAGGPGGPPVGAPEVDPASAISALTLLAGSLVVLRSRRPRARAE